MKLFQSKNDPDKQGNSNRLRDGMKLRMITIIPVMKGTASVKQ
jgi:hypothetical protein